MSPPEPLTTDDDLSAASTTITFDSPIPLLRGPTRPAKPHHGPYLLAFRDPKSWFHAHGACEAKLLHQCKAGSRFGCALSAAEKCKPPWWKLVFGGKIDMSERAACEERETEMCVATAKERCVVFAREKCVGPFRGARVCGMGRKEAAEMVGWVTVTVTGKSRWVGLVGLEKCGFGVTSCRAEEMVGCCDEVDRVLGRTV